MARASRRPSRWSGHDLQADVFDHVRPARGDARPLRGGARRRAGRPRGHARAARRGAGRPRDPHLREAEPGGPASRARALRSRRHGRRGPGDGRGRGRLPGLARDGPGRARAPREAGLVPPRGARLYHRRRPRPGGRQEPHGGARRDPGDRRLLLRLRGGVRAQPALRPRPPRRSAPGVEVAQPLRPQALRRLGRDHSLQLPPGPGRGAGGGGARHRQHGRPQGSDRHPVGRPPPRGLHSRRGLPVRGLQLRDGPGQRRGGGAHRARRPRRRHLHRVPRGGHEPLRQDGRGGAIPGPASPRWAERTPAS